MERENELEHLKKTVSGLLDRLPPNLSSRFPNNSLIETPKASQVVCSLLSTVRPAGLDASVEAIKHQHDQSQYSPFSYQEWDQYDNNFNNSENSDFEDIQMDPFYIDPNGNDTLYGDPTVQLIRCNFCSKVLKLSVFAEHIEWCKRQYHPTDANNIQEDEEIRQKSKKRRKIIENTEEPKTPKRTKPQGVSLSTSTTNRVTGNKKKDPDNSDSKGTDHTGNGVTPSRTTSNSKGNLLIQIPKETPIVKDAAQIVLTFLENLSHKKYTSKDLQTTIGALKYSQPTPLATHHPPRDGYNIFEEAGVHLTHLKTNPNMEFPIMKFRRKDAIHYSHPIPIEIDIPTDNMHKIPGPGKITSPIENVPLNQSIGTPGGLGIPNCMNTGIQNITPQLRDRPQIIQRTVGRRLDSVPPPPPEQKPLISPQNGNTTTTPAYPCVPGALPNNVREPNGTNNNIVRRPREGGVSTLPWNNRSSSFPY